MPTLRLETRWWRPGGHWSACGLGGAAVPSEGCAAPGWRLRALRPRSIGGGEKRRGRSGIGGHVTSTNPVTEFCFLPQHRPLPRLPPRSPPASNRGKGRSGRRRPPGGRGRYRRGSCPPAAPGPLGRRAMAESGTGSSGPWWKSLTNSRKNGKEGTVGAQPPAQPAPGEPAPPSPDWTSGSQENQHPNLLGGAGEPHKPDKFCGEKSGNSRRNLKISRSGRFKEKRKMRATLLPEGVKSPEEAGFPGDPQDDKQ